MSYDLESWLAARQSGDPWPLASPEVRAIMERAARAKAKREDELYAKRQREEQDARLAGRPSALTISLRRKRALAEALRRRMGPSGYLTTAIMGRR